MNKFQIAIQLISQNAIQKVKNIKNKIVSIIFYSERLMDTKFIYKNSLVTGNLKM